MCPSRLWARLVRENIALSQRHVKSNPWSSLSLLSVGRQLNLMTTAGRRQTCAVGFKEIRFLPEAVQWLLEYLVRMCVCVYACVCVYTHVCLCDTGFVGIVSALGAALSFSLLSKGSSWASVLAGNIP